MRPVQYIASTGDYQPDPASAYDLSRYDSGEQASSRHANW